MPLPKGLFAQALDFSKSTGSKMNPEQTNRALQKIVNLGTSSESKAYREKLVKGVKDTALLEDPSVERAYAVGSSTTDKEFPKDIDILARGKSGEKDAYIADNYRYMGRDTDETEGVDLFLPQTERYSKGGRFLGYSKGKEREDKIKNEMLSEGERYTKTYGEDHRWIRLVAIPAAAGLGLLTPEDSEAAFKPVAVAKAAAALIKDNANRLKSPNADKQIMDVLNKRSTFAGEKPTAIRTPTRVGGIIDSMIKIPQKEYNYFDNLMIKKNIDPIGGTQGDFLTGRELRNYTQTNPSKIRLDSFAADKDTFPHEAVHARQAASPKLMRFMDELQSHIEKWIKNPWERYWNDPAEVHARGMEGAVGKLGSGEIEQTLYDEIYRNELAKTLQFTEKFLQGKDPTFKARFLKNVAIGGAVMTALQLGPEGSPTEAEAMPRGVYEKAGKLMAEVSRTAKDLIGKETEPGKVIQNVFKGKGSERRLVFEDGTQSIVDKNDVIKLARAFGTKEYETRFLGKEPEGQLSQAIKSMQLHEATAQNKSFLTRGTVRQYTDRYLQDLAQMGKMLPPDTCFVEKGGLLFTMPRFYAELLEENGLLNIVKTKKYLDIVNKNKVK